MLLWLLVQIPVTILNTLTSWLPQVTALPMGLDAILANGMANVVFLFDFFPPLQTLYTAFLIVISFKISVKVFAMIPFIGKLLHR